MASASGGQEQRRALAAVVFTDVADFTALMERDEDRAMRLVKRDLGTIEQLCGECEGRVLKNVGDGLLMYFGSAVQAVRCAIRAQETMAAAAAGKPAEEVLKHRIGIHLGDVFVTEQDVMGEGVNVAARLQHEAAPGGICISQTVYDVVKNRLRVQATYLGPRELKNIKEAVPVYQILLEGLRGEGLTAENAENAERRRAGGGEGGEGGEGEGRGDAETRRRGEQEGEKKSGVKGGMEFLWGGVSKVGRKKGKEEKPFCMAVMGDFTGRGNRRLCEPGRNLAARVPVAVDVDNFWMLPGKLGASLRIPAGPGGAEVTIGFADMDDFHPDRLFDRLGVFGELKELRKALREPKTAEKAAATVRGWGGEAVAGSPEPVAGGKEGEKKESVGETLERLLGKKQGEKKTGEVVEGVAGLIRQAVAPHVVPAGVEELVGRVDARIASQMRAILMNSDFRAMEAAWRGLHTLVSNVETDETLKVYLIDVSREELSGDLLGREAKESGMWRLMVEQSVGMLGGQGWTLMVGCWEFDRQADDVALLGQLGRIAQAAGAPLVAAGAPGLAGCRSFAVTPDPDDWQWPADGEAGGAWAGLRGSAVASYVGLTAPRFMLRLPYGKDGEAIERFDFQELSDPMDHEGYLWGSGAFLVACLLGGAFRESGWELSESLVQEIGGLAMHVVTAKGRRTVVPCGEAYLTDRAMAALLGAGLMPVMSVKGRDSVMVPRVASVGGGDLEGRWR